MDQISDLNGAGLYKVARAMPLPKFVKEAQLATAEDVRELRSEAFADSRARRYPLDTPENAWLSCAYFEKFAKDQYGRDSLAEIKGRLKEAAVFWNFEYPEPVAQAAPESLTIKYAMDGAVHDELTVDGTDESLRLVADDLQKQAQHYPYPMRQAVARQLLAASRPETFKQEEYVALEKLAGYGVSTLAAAEELLQGRKYLLLQPEAQARVDSALAMLKTAARGGLLSPNMTDKVARLADSIDRLAGQHVRYTPETLPERKLFSLTASQMDDFHKHAVKLANGAVLTPDEVQDGRLREFVHNFTGEKVAADQMCARLQQFDSRTCDLAVRVLRKR